MLILTFAKDESAILTGGIRVKYLGGHGRNIKLGFDAPKEIGIVRESIVERIKAGERLGDIEREYDAAEQVKAIKENIK